LQYLLYISPTAVQVLVAMKTLSSRKTRIRFKQLSCWARYFELSENVITFKRIFQEFLRDCFITCNRKKGGSLDRRVLRKTNKKIYIRCFAVISWDTIISLDCYFSTAALNSGLSTFLLWRCHGPISIWKVAASFDTDSKTLRNCCLSTGNQYTLNLTCPSWPRSINGYQYGEVACDSRIPSTGTETSATSICSSSDEPSRTLYYREKIILSEEIKPRRNCRK
jgi:hypothetical protein